MRVLLLLMTLLLAAPAFAQARSPEVLQAAVEQVIRPGMLEFRARANGLSLAMNALCRAVGEYADAGEDAVPAGGAGLWADRIYPHRTTDGEQ